MLGEAAAVKALENQLTRGGLKLTALLTPLRLSRVKQKQDTYMDMVNINLPPLCQAGCTTAV